MLKPGEIGVKDTKVLEGLMERRFHPLLITIILSIAKDYGIFITESYREKRHMGDVHATQPVRALDLRFWAYPEQIAYEIQYKINKQWEYDPERPGKEVVLIHKVTGGGIHFHIQVHPRTRRRQ